MNFDKEEHSNIIKTRLVHDVINPSVARSTEDSNSIA